MISFKATYINSFEFCTRMAYKIKLNITMLNKNNKFFFIIGFT